MISRLTHSCRIVGYNKQIFQLILDPTRLTLELFNIISGISLDIMPTNSYCDEVDISQ